MSDALKGKDEIQARIELALAQVKSIQREARNTAQHLAQLRDLIADKKND